MSHLNVNANNQIWVLTILLLDHVTKNSATLQVSIKYTTQVTFSKHYIALPIHYKFTNINMSKGLAYYIFSLIQG